MANPNLIDRWFFEAFTPDPILTVSQWADKNRVLSRKAASEAGPWRTERTPYLRRIMDVLSVTHPCKKVVFKKASQVGGTETGNNWIGYIIDHAPGPTMIVWPRIEDAKKNSHLRIQPLIDESPALRKKMAPTRAKDTTNTVLQKDFDSGTLIISGANSSSSMKSMPARFIFGDEIDEWPRNVQGQGSPIALLAARSRTFSRRKFFLTSTPTFEGASLIDEEFEESTQEHYYVQCPHCHHAQILEFENLQWTAGKPETVLYYCVGCGTGIEERYKTKMLLDKEGGGTAEWIPHNPGHETIGVFLNALYSPIGWLSWVEIAKDYEKAKRKLDEEKNDEDMIAFYNTVLGKSYKHSGDAPEWQKIYDRREKYPIGSVPEGVIFLSLGCDVQKDRIECELVGFGVGKESWSVDYQVFRGDTSKPEVWAELEAYMGSTFPCADGESEMSIRIVGIDANFNTQHVYAFVRRFSPNQVVALQGRENQQMPIALPKVVDVKLKGTKVKRRGAKVWGVAVNLFKTELYNWLKLEPARDEMGDIKTDELGRAIYPKGYCHFPEYDAEYFKQLTAERIVIRRNKKGFSVFEFVKDRERNEALDCRVYARAAASMVGLDRLKDHDFEKFRVQTIAKSLKTVDTKPESQPKRKKPDREKRQRRLKSESDSFWRGYD